MGHMSVFTYDFLGYMPSSGITDSCGHIWQPTLVFVPGEPHGQRSQAVHSPWGRKELDMTERLTLHMVI